MAEQSLANLYATKSDKGHTHAGTEITSVVANATNAVNATSVPWGGISGKPNTLTGYGIIDAAAAGHTHAGTDITSTVANATTASVCTGNSATATKLAAAKTINGVAFDGSANITINAVDSTPRIASSEKGAANGVATLDAAGLVPTSQLPSYVDDIQEYASSSVFPTTGEKGKIYVALDSDKIYRWSGSTYIEVSPTAGNADSATKLATARTIAASGDVVGTATNFDGSVNITIPMTLSNSGVAAGVYKSVTVDAKGRVTAGTNPTTLVGYGITDAVSSTGTAAAATKLANARTINGVSFDGTTNITINAVDSTPRIASSEKGVANGVATLDATGLIPTSQLPSFVDDIQEYTNLSALPATGEKGKIYVTLDNNKIYRWSGSVYIEVSPTAGNADSATKLATARTISLTGDATGSMSFDGSANVSAALTLAASGVTAGTYRSITVDAKGRVTAGTNPTTLAGYGITDALSSSDAVTTATANKILRLNASGLLPASITGNAATATTATTASAVAWTGVTGKPTTVDGYGITDAMEAVSDGTYYGLKTPAGSTSDWIRTTTNGFIPQVSGGSGSIGTAGWPFLNLYATNIYGTLKGTAWNIPTSDVGGNIWIS